MPVQKLLDFLKLSSRVERTPGFSSALGLSFDSISKLPKDAIDFDRSTKSLKLRLPTDPLRSKLSNDIYLSTYMAALDDITTWALVLADDKRSRAGVSVALRSEWGPKRKLASRISDAVDITATVSKIGNNMGFCNAQVRDPASGELVCFGSHIKYMPMGFVTDFALKNWNLTKLYSEYGLKDPEPQQHKAEIDSLFENNLRIDNFDTGRFSASKAHSSLGGPIHGGCQAVLMERIGTEYATKCFGHAARLDSISVDYMSPPRSKEVVLKVDEIVHHQQESSLSASTIRVRLVGDDERVKSEGVLHFSQQ